MADIKEEMRRIIDELPEDATWDDVIHLIYVQKLIAEGQADSAADCPLDMNEVRKRLNL